MTVTVEEDIDQKNALNSKRLGAVLTARKARTFRINRFGAAHASSKYTISNRTFGSVRHTFALIDR